MKYRTAGDPVGLLFIGILPVELEARQWGF
jgi:hypothetical protein